MINTFTDPKGPRETSEADKYWHAKSLEIRSQQDDNKAYLMIKSFLIVKLEDQGKLIDIFNRDVWAPYRRDVAEGNAEWQKKFSVDVGCHTALAWRNDVPLPDSEGNEFFVEYDFYRWAKDEADEE